MRLRVALAVGALLLPLASGPIQAEEESERPETRAAMRELFAALTTAFTASLRDEEFQRPEERERILTALRALERNADSFEAHGRELSPSYDFLRHSLAVDAREIVLRYEQGSYEGARFLLHQLTEDCFACHSRVSNPRGFSLGKRFLEKIDLQKLTTEERVKLEVATRQFSAALASYEGLFRDTSVPAAEISLSGAFEDYLKIVLRVTDDVARARKTLVAFRERPDVPRYLDKYLQGWIRSLTGLDLKVPEGLDLFYAREHIRQGQLANFFPEDRQGLVHFVGASTLLHRYLEHAPPTGEGLAEAYYLLGVTESYISRSAWISETEFFLENAIRIDPGSPYAARAYAFLEEYLVAGYTGSSGLHLPPETEARLGELRALLDEPAAELPASAP